MPVQRGNANLNLELWVLNLTVLSYLPLLLCCYLFIIISSKELGAWLLHTFPRVAECIIYIYNLWAFRLVLPFLPDYAVRNSWLRISISINYPFSSSQLYKSGILIQSLLLNSFILRKSQAFS